MLTTLHEVLTPARQHAYAVPAFDCVEDVMVRAILDTAEARRAPVILMCLPTDLVGRGMVYLPGLIRAVADAYTIPIVLHLDHATDLDLVQAAIEQGFTSVMIDGSRLPFTDNVRLTRAAVDLALASNLAGHALAGDAAHSSGAPAAARAEAGRGLRS